MLQYTGGTTGVSKGAVLLHRNLVANLLQAEAWYQPALKKIPPGEQIVDRVRAAAVSHLRLQHEHDAVDAHGRLQHPDPQPARHRRGAEGAVAAPFHSFPAVNTLFNAMAHHPDFDNVDWSHLKISVGGGMAVQQATARLWLEKTGCPIVEGYGLSETSPSATCNPVDSTAYSGNIGLPMPNTELALLDDDGHEVPLGTAGRDRDPRAAGDGRLLAAPRRDRQGDDGATASSAPATSAWSTSAATSASSTARRT